MDLFETWEDQEIQFDLSIRYYYMINLLLIYILYYKDFGLVNCTKTIFYKHIWFRMYYYSEYLNTRSFYL